MHWIKATKYKNRRKRAVILVSTGGISLFISFSRSFGVSVSAIALFCLIGLVKQTALPIVPVTQSNCDNNIKSRLARSFGPP